MTIQHDRKITISAAGSRRAVNWPEQSLYWSELVERLRTPARGAETLDEYRGLPKSKQDDLKDVGGFVAGALAGGRRKAGSVTGRDVITLDMDNIPPGGTQDVLKSIEALGCAYAVYSTRKHCEAKPRLRVLVPLARTAAPDEYEPVTRKLAEFLGIQLCDPSTFEASRLMYWPSCCADSSYVYQYGDKPMLDADGMLGLYADWRDVTSWPQVPGAQEAHKKLAARQGDPLAKKGMVGAFCRVYNVYRVMEDLLPGVYIPSDTGGRYTYAEGSTTGGAVIYDDGNFLYSHHATDPCGGRLVNAFDLVRLHKFGDLDDDAKPDTPPNRLPSYEAMCRFAAENPEVAAIVNKERYEETVKEFSDAGEADTDWIKLIKTSPTTCQPLKTTANAALLLEHDPRLKGRIKRDLFADRLIGCAPLPWGKHENETGWFMWADEDDSGLRMYVEKIMGFRAKDVIEDALKNHAAKEGYNPVTDYLNALSWDGVKRLSALFIDYLGAADNDYTRAITRKAFTAAVARVMTPGCKFDNMTILTGAQGIGKSTLLKKMGRDWFSDSIKSFEGKEASELVQGVWLVEIAELEAFNRTEVGRIKQFLSQQEDIYRAAYGRNIGWHPRRCVFFGTSNNGEYLRDKTGNRRFWPVDVGVTAPAKSVFSDLDNEVDQLWAEAVVYWRLGESLYLPKEIEAVALEEQENHREHSAREGLIMEFVERRVPKDWNKWPIDRRRIFWSGNAAEEGMELVERTQICALEVWCEAIGGDYKSMKYSDATEINNVITAIPNWKKQKTPRKYGYCGSQRGFEKQETN